VDRFINEARPMKHSAEPPREHCIRILITFAAKSPNTKKPSVSGGLGRMSSIAAYFLALRLNFEVNFSTRPAVSTKRFSPV
jgi:hypothetical protein